MKQSIKRPIKSNNLAKSIQRYVQCLAAGAVSAALLPGWAMAQDADDPSGQRLVLEEIIVTGTLIRGIEPTGSKPIGISNEDIITKGAVTTNELLAALPQVSNFNGIPEQDPRGAALTVISRPNLRNLPGMTSSSGATTLVLVNGHRLTPVGIDQASLDPDIIPSAVIERVEIITDGGSSLYGADAVGGVINFITKKEFDGVQVDLNYGVGDDYDIADVSLMGGTSWDGGSILVSLSRTERDGVKNADRDWATRGTWTADGVMPIGSQCLEPVGAIETWFHHGGGWTNNPLAPGAGITPVGTPCDILSQDSLLPERERDNLWVSISQELTDSVSFNMQAYYTEQDTTFSRYPLGGTISGTSPVELGVPGVVGDLYAVPSMGFSYGAHPAYRHRNMEIDYETWGFSPEFVIDLNNGWQLRQTFHYGRSETTLVDPASDQVKMLEYYDDGNGPFDPANIAGVDAAIINDILDYENVGQTIQEMFLARMIADGVLMALPAGNVRMAAGIEFTQDRARKRQGATGTGRLHDLTSRGNSRDIKAAFAEVNIPVLDSLDLSLSVRHDDYSDFGETTNPNIGFNFTPTDWVSIFGHWGESFNAPTAVDGLGEATIRNYFTNQATGVPDPFGVRDPSRMGLLQVTGLTGGTLLPQTAESWAVGFEIEPPMAEGLRLGATYYEIKFDNILGAPDPQQVSSVLANPDKFIFNPTQAELDHFLSIVNNAEQFIDIIDAAGLGVILDRRTTNTDSAILEGIDFSIGYQHETRFGSMYYGLSGNHALEFKVASSGNPFTDNLAEGVPDLNVAGTLAWSRDNLRARLTMKYSNGFDTSTASLGQTSVGSFLVTDLFVGYDVDETLSLRFNIDNVFDRDPPTWRQEGFNLPYSGFTLGRVFKLGLTKSFF